MWARTSRRAALAIVATATVAVASGGPMAWAQSSAADGAPQTLWREFPLEPDGAAPRDRGDSAATLVADRRAVRAQAAADGRLPLGLVLLGALAGLTLLAVVLREARGLATPGPSGSAVVRRRLLQMVAAEPDWRAVRLICATGFGALVGFVIAGTWT